MHYVALAQVLILLSLANGSPVIAKRIVVNYAAPVDRNARFFDERPLVGPSKTIRGIVISLLVTALGAIVLGLQFWLGLLVASTAMAGDLFSSLLTCRSELSLTALDIAVACAVFFASQIIFSRLFFWLQWRDRPY
jgi:CDP-2,3-bis-(O-geranylgeranyl)-sn-glycerol synthase